MDKDSKQVVVLLTHPNIKESRANKALMDAISDMGEVAIYNLYEMRVEDAFNAEIWSTIISHASALVFQFPFYWMSAPSLLKRWLYNPQIEMFARFKMKSSFHKTKRII
jgi:glutathione-regulated potassium-efflux system ancillary protein KefG